MSCAARRRRRPCSPTPGPESERADTLPSRRREELDARIAEDVETLCFAVARLRTFVERIPMA